MKDIYEDICNNMNLFEEEPPEIRLENDILGNPKKNLLIQKRVNQYINNILELRVSEDAKLKLNEILNQTLRNTLWSIRNTIPLKSKGVNKGKLRFKTINMSLLTLWEARIDSWNTLGGK